MKGQIYLSIGEVRMSEPERSRQVDEKGAAEAACPRQPLPRLLVIDDDYLHRKIICRVAAKAGYAPAGAATYDEAAKLALENAFDCISLDLSLGWHGGLEMLHYLRGIGCKAAIIMLSGTDQATVHDTLRAAKSLNLDIRETVLKPVDLEMLRYSFERIRTKQHAPAAA
jgi:two-component system, chemotaxis family, chemotaxis protein CheY